RGFDEWCPSCARGEINLCERYTEGDLARGIILGACRDTSGSWSPYFIAHRSQLHAVPDAISDEDALMVEPFACGLHAALLDFPKDDETILLLGAGTIGLMQLAALRALGSRATILVAARYAFQAEAALKLGASEVFTGGDLYKQVAARTGAKLLKPLIGKRVIVGGADRTYECVGNDSALDDALRLTKSGGLVMVVGVPGLAKGIDWTAVFSQELQVRAAQAYGQAEVWQGKPWDAFALTLDLMERGELDLGWMVNRRYALDEYKQALKQQGNKKQYPVIKAVFEF
ncbi:MAG: zinc-binding dehydrogenase, partial [Anaerolineae bacterium]|nr:zinc-binding dehydrogenase [Anaerolineae bacterium]